MSDSAVWIAVAASLIGCYFAASNIALKGFGRARLSEVLVEAGHVTRLGLFVRQTSNLLLMTELVRAYMGLVVLWAVHHCAGLHDAVNRGLVRGWVRGLVVLVVAGGLVSIFMVAVPMSLARAHRERWLVHAYHPLWLGLFLLRPLVFVLNLLDPFVRRLTGGDRSQQVSELGEEIRSVVEEHDAQGTVNEAQKEMLEAVVDFSSTTAGQIMTPRTDVQGIEIDATLEQVKEAILLDGHSRIPVYDQNLDHIVGVLYAKDLIQHLGGQGPIDLRRVLRDALMVPESKPVRQLLAEFKSRKVHIAIVLDEYGGTAGLVTIEDIIEEIVGEIQDEYEPGTPSPNIRRLNDHTVEVDARVRIEELNDELNLHLPEQEDYDTLGGFVLATLGHIPVAGESFEFEQAQLTVTAAERTKVTRVRIDTPESVPVVRNGYMITHGDRGDRGDRHTPS